MLDNLTSEDIASEVKLCRDNFSGTLVIVEGRSDHLFFSRFVDKSHCQIITGYGKENCISVVTLLESESFEGLLAIVDADFWNLFGCPITSSNILVTEFHDLEIMILQSNACYYVLDEFGSTAKIDRFLESSGGADIRHIVFSRALPIGILRRISERDKLNLTFKGLSYKKIINKETLKIDIEKLVRQVLTLSQTTEINDDNLLRVLLEELTDINHDLTQICCGHDVVAIICIGLRKALGNQQAIAVQQENVESILRLSYDSNDFKSTQLYSESKIWETNNQPYRVFKI